ncbi:MAG: phosphoenolpyruvate--protein phosphotransferase, partial [Spirochaetaceae bacterium]|nr:phosphoenolpyruvate--protein phosphotransferase [Spirochaetaceae bacterium]
MEVLKGKGASGGVAIGRMEFFERVRFEAERKSVKNVEAELERFADACEKAKEQLDFLVSKTAARLGKKNAELFGVHKMMLEDEDFLDAVNGLIKDDAVCAEYAVVEIGKQFAADFEQIDDEYMRARAADVLDVSGRVLGILSGIQRSDSLGQEPVILAADDFSPSETAQFDRSMVLGLATQAGSSNSHTSIFARTMGIPAVIGLGPTLSPSLAHNLAALDGDTGLLHIDPEPEVLKDLKEKQAKLQIEVQALERFRGMPTLTKSGKKIKLYANIGSVADADAAVLGDAEGVGLFR